MFGKTWLTLYRSYKIFFYSHSSGGGGGGQNNKLKQQENSGDGAQAPGPSFYPGAHFMILVKVVQGIL